MDTLPSNNFNEEPYIKWAVGLSELGHAIVSNTFTYRGVQRHLKLTTHPNPYKTDWVSLYLISEDDYFQPHEMTVFIEAPPNKTSYFTRVCVIHAVQDISSYNRKEVCDYMREFKWNSVTFTFLFPGQTDLKICKGIQNSPSNSDLTELERLSADIAKLLQDPFENDNDAVLKCEGKLFYLHTEILSARSEKFAELFTGSNSQGAHIPIKIKDLDKASLQGIVQYLYTGKLNTELDTDGAERLYRAARSYSVVSMAKRCADFLIESLTHDNCLDILRLAHSEEDYDLKKRVILYVLDKKIPRQKERWTVFCKDHRELAWDVYVFFYESHCID